MNVLGIVAEYNPFHTGHLLHLANSKKNTKAEYAIAVMGGNFTQRGEPAIFNKWARAKMAISAGIDLVIELPFAYATGSAGFFASGAIEILERCGIVTHLSFGSESGSISDLKSLAKILAEEPVELKELIRKEMSAGVTLPTAQTKALAIYMKTDNKDIAELVKKPNNVLGLEYLKALSKKNSNIIPVTVRRIMADHHSQSLNENIASSTAIRDFIYTKGLVGNQLKKVLGDNTLEIIGEEIQEGRGPVFYQGLTLPLITSLRTIDSTTLSKISDVNEGLENRIIWSARNSASLENLIAGIKSKRYTRTRIQRILLHSLLTFAKTDAKLLNDLGPQYIRVLGFNEKGRLLLNAMKKKASLPIVIKVADAGLEGDPAKLSLEYDIKATDLYTTLYPNPMAGLGRQDFLQGPVRL